MGRLKNIYTAVEFIDIALATWIAIALDHRLSKDFHGWAIWISTATVSISGFTVIRLCKRLIRTEPVQKGLLGCDFIEGTWVDFYPAADKRIKHVAILTIKLEGDEYTVHGRTFEVPTFRERGSFASLSAGYQDGVLYQTYRESVHGESRIGAGEFKFDHSTSGYPLRYQFTIVDTLHNAVLMGRGLKVEDARDLHALRSGVGLAAVLNRYLEIGSKGAGTVMRNV